MLEASAPYDMTGLPSSYIQNATEPSTSAPKINPLEEALRLTTGDRQNSYGHPIRDFSRTAAMWTALIGDKLLSPITAQDVAWMMVLLKASRQQNRNKLDNLVDAAGYINCAHMVIEAENEKT